MNSDSRLVYSSDPSLNQKCPKCRELTAACTCAADAPVNAGEVAAVLRIEKSGRSGKTVTVIDRLPRSENYLKDLCSELKKKCGSGGTFRIGADGGVVEIQGDKREMIRAALAKKGIKSKG
jgi:translation initiation factor 1